MKALRVALPSFFSYKNLRRIFMCGICASIGNDNQIRNVISGLKTLEYRGYDSSGVALLKNGKISVVKSVGQIKCLQEKLAYELDSKIVIGHTRWATHGKVCEENSHPHLSFDKKVAIVHNGIIENFEQLKKQLLNVKFYSQTDTEVFANLIASHSGSNIERLVKASKMVKGSFAVAVMFESDNKIYCAKRKSPLYIGFRLGQVMASSDVSAFGENFDYFYKLDDDEFAVITKDKIDIFDKEIKLVNKAKDLFEKAPFFDDFSEEKCFMKKEILEQPIVLKRTFFKYFSEKIIDETTLTKMKKFKKFHFVACGTAYHSALLGAEYLREFAKKDCEVSVASEFRYGFQNISKNCLYVFVSQSGETADTIACAEMVKLKGAQTLCVTNVPYCTLNNLADFVLPTFAGKEVAVASTKAYVAQVFTMLIFALLISDKDMEEELKKFALQFSIKALPDEVLNSALGYSKIFFVGRVADYVTSLEGALKLKEISYINCIAIAAGELKHGTLALVDEDTLVVVVSTREDLKEKIENNIQEIRARGGKILLLSQFEHHVDVEYEIRLSKFMEMLMPIESVVQLQQLALSFALEKGFDPDKPRNLAKSVTVE